MPEPNESNSRRDSCGCNAAPLQVYLDVQAVAVLFKELVRDAKVAETVVESNSALSGLRDKVKLVVACCACRCARARAGVAG